MGNIHKGHRKRLKEEFLQLGMDHFPDHRVLELLLFYAIPRLDTNELGHELLEQFGTITGVFDASYELLVQVPGMGENSATLIKVAAALIRRYMDDYTSRNNVIDSPEAAKEYMRYKFLCEQRECIYLACMGHNGKIIFCTKVTDGSPESVSVAPSEIVKLALRADAAKAFIAHNHPNGLCLPSNRDIRVTSILFDTLRQVDVELTDHIIVAPDGVYSMVESNMFPACRN